MSRFLKDASCKESDVPSTFPITFASHLILLIFAFPNCSSMNNVKLLSGEFEFYRLLIYYN